jgi:hypothetical protein
MFRRVRDQFVTMPIPSAVTRRHRRHGLTARTTTA